MKQDCLIIKILTINMKKLKAPRLVTVFIFTTITVIFWVFMGLYNVITSTPPINVDPELLKPINPILNQEALDRLENRIHFEEGQTISPFVFKESPPELPVEESPTIIEEDEEISPDAYFDIPISD